MKKSKRILMVILIAVFPLTVFAQENDEGIISIYEGSEVIYDYQVGFEEFPLLVSDDSFRTFEGRIRRQWCQAPDDRSPLEIIRNYQQAIREMGGELLFITRDPQSIEVEGKKLSEYFKYHRLDKNYYTVDLFPEETMSEFLTARIETPDATYYLAIASGKGHWAERKDHITYFEIVTIEVESMDIGMVTMDALREGIAAYGKALVYNIHFETGSVEVRP